MMNQAEKSATATTPVKVPHSIQIDRRRKTVITGVMDVCSFHETEIVLQLEQGRMYLTGQDLHIGKLLPEESRLDVSGQIDSVVYETPRRPSNFRWLFRKGNA